MFSFFWNFQALVELLHGHRIRVSKKTETVLQLFKIVQMIVIYEHKNPHNLMFYTPYMTSFPNRCKSDTGYL